MMKTARSAARQPELIGNREFVGASTVGHQFLMVEAVVGIVSLVSIALSHPAIGRLRNQCAPVRLHHKRRHWCACTRAYDAPAPEDIRNTAVEKACPGRGSNGSAGPEDRPEARRPGAASGNANQRSANTRDRFRAHIAFVVDVSDSTRQTFRQQ
jgi:hypothetical protein